MRETASGTFQGESFIERWWPALAVGAVVLAAHLATNGRYGYFRDELYFIICGRHPAWGYVDQPPFTPLVAAGSAWLSGDSLDLFRLPAALAHVALIVTTAAFARWLGGRTFAQLLAAVCAAAGSIFLSQGHLLTMNAFEPLSWLALAWLVAAQLRDPRPRRWVAAGAVLGVALLNKHSAAFYAATLLLGVLLTKERRRLFSPWVAAGAGIALLLFAPHLAWQASHGWPMFELLRNGQLYKNAPFVLSGFLSQVVMALHPASLPIWAAGLFFVSANERGRSLRFLGWGFAALLVLMIALKAKFYYLAPAFPPLLAAGAFQWELWTVRWPRVRLAIPAALTVAGTATAPLVIPALSPERFLAYQRALGIEAPHLERLAYREMPQVFADEFGWRELAENVADVYRALPAADRANAVVFGRNYGEAAALDFFGGRLGGPRAVSGHNNYWLWGAGNPSVIIIIGGHAEDHHDACNSVELARRLPPNPYVMPYEDELPLFICRDLKAPLAEFWPRVRYYK